MGTIYDETQDRQIAIYEKQNHKVAKVYNTVAELAKDWGVGHRLKNDNIPWLNTQWYVKDYCVGFVVDEYTSVKYNEELEIYQSSEKFLTKPKGKLKFYVKTEDKEIKFESISKLSRFIDIPPTALKQAFHDNEYKTNKKTELNYWDNFILFSQYE
jgi:hypothetical protein